MQPTLAPAALARLAVQAADGPHRWRDLVRYDPAERWYRRLAATEDYEIWLLSWLPGQGTGFHDHGSSAGAFTVVLGSLRERVAAQARSQATEPPLGTGRTLRTGAVRSFGRDYLHDVRNDSVDPAVSIHAYSPPLRTMRRYNLSAGRLRLADVESW
jgi:predicted metal-dependent enzyme (double-stranded beta helix superfamily)